MRVKGYAQPIAPARAPVGPLAGVLNGGLACPCRAKTGFRRLKVKIAIYAAVSINNDQVPEVQLRELREYCQRRGWEITREYVDVGISGGKEKRRRA
jgi:hypothetical protein